MVVEPKVFGRAFLTNTERSEDLIFCIKVERGKTGSQELIARS